MVDEELEEAEKEESEGEGAEPAEGEEEEVKEFFPEALLITATGCLILAIIIVYYVLGNNYGIGLFKSAYSGG